MNKRIPLLSTLALVSIGLFWMSKTLLHEEFEFHVPAEYQLQNLILNSSQEALSIEQTEELPQRTEGQVLDTELLAIATSLLQNWEFTPPPHATDGTFSYTLGDSFGLLANALRYYNQLGSLPLEVEFEHLIEPQRALDVEQALQIEPAFILKGVDLIEINDKTGLNSTISIEHVTLTSGQMLYAMAELYLYLHENETAGTELPTYLYIPPTENI